MTGYAEEQSTRFLSLERFADSVSTLDCTNSQVSLTFGDAATYSAVQQSWNWMNQDGHTVYLVIGAGECGLEQRTVYAASGVTFGGDGSVAADSGADSSSTNNTVSGNSVSNNTVSGNSTSSGSSGAGVRTATVQVTKSNWEEAVPRGRLELDTRGLLQQGAADAVSVLSRRQDVEGDTNSFDFSKANVQNRRLLDFDPRSGGQRDGPVQGNSGDPDAQPGPDSVAEADRAPFYLECEYFCLWSQIVGTMLTVPTFERQILRPRRLCRRGVERRVQCWGPLWR